MYIYLYFYAPRSRAAEMETDDNTSNDNWSDAEDSGGVDSDWTTTDTSSSSADESASDISSSSHGSCQNVEHKKFRTRAKRARIAAEEYAKSAPHCILPIGMGSIFWQYFGFPVWSDGDCLTRQYISCSYCLAMLRCNSQKVFPKMRAHLQHCNKEVYRRAAEEHLKTPLVLLNKIPNVLVTSIQGNKIWKWLQKRDSQHETASPERKEDKKQRLEDAMFLVEVESLRPGMMGTAGAVNLIHALLATGKPKPDCEMPEVSNDSFSTKLAEKYKIAKAKVVAALKLCSEYSMCVEEWMDTENTVFITFSVNYVKDGDLKNSILLTRPKNLDEISDALATLTDDLGIDLNKVSALVTNSDIPFADFWNSEAQTQFLPCFCEAIIRAIRDGLFQLPYVKALLEKLNFKMWPYCDVQIVLIRFEDCLNADKLCTRKSSGC
jgi:hypothetical protein